MWSDPGFAATQTLRHVLAEVLRTRRPLVTIELVLLARIDVAVRRTGRRCVRGLAASVVDSEIRRIIRRYGWPGIATVGECGARAAWLIVQHLDADVTFQASCLGLVREAVAIGDAPVATLAYLTDRLRLNRGLPQVFGTQLVRGRTGKLVPWFIEDPARVNERRAAVGLGTMEVYRTSADAAVARTSDA